MSDTNAPAGWYPVAEGSAQLRYWDGTQWTEHTHDPAQAAQAQATQAAAAQGQATQQAGYAGAQQPVYAAVVGPKAPEGTEPNTIMGWLNAATPLLLLIDLIPLYFWMTNFFEGISFTGNTAPDDLVAREFNSTYALILLLAFASQALFVLFAGLDWRTLRRNGVPSPFHWAWSFFTFLTFGGRVYVIGRAIVVRRRTDKSGYGPMVLYIVLTVLYAIVSIVVVIVVFVSLQGQIHDQLNTSGGVA
jgi:hypothetical protein